MNSNNHRFASLKSPLTEEQIAADERRHLMRCIYGIALMVCIESNNPEGGLSHDSADNDIIEVVTDIAQGSPHNIEIDRNSLSETEEANILRAFCDGAYDRS